MSNGHPAGNELRKALRLLAVATIAVYVAVAALTIYVFVISSQNKAALCSFKQDLEGRAAASQELLDNNKGEMIFGIPREVIENTQSNQQKTVESLRDLSC